MTDTTGRIGANSGTVDSGGSAGALCHGQAASARWHLASHLRLWPVAAITLAIDLWTKHWAFTSLDPRESRVIIPHLMTFQRSLNAGALFGLGKGWTPLFIAASFLALAFVFFLFIHSTRDRRSLHVALALVLAGALGNLHDRIFEIADVIEFYPGGATGGKVTQAGTISDPPPNVPPLGPNTVWLGEWKTGDHPKAIPGTFSPRVRQQGVVRDFIKMEPRFTLFDREIEIWPWVFNIADALLVAGVGLLLLNFWWDRKAERAAMAAARSSTGASRDDQDLH